MRCRNVLIVDDEAPVRTGLTVLIPWESLGYRIVGLAGNADEALAQVEQGAVDLVLSDVKMPGKSGLDLIRELRQREFSGDFLLLSAYDEFSFARQALDLGVESYLLKPVDEKALIDVLVRLRGKHEQKEEEQQRNDQFFRNYCLKQALQEGGRESCDPLIRALRCQRKSAYYFCLLDQVTASPHCVEGLLGDWLQGTRCCYFRVGSARLVLLVLEEDILPHTLQNWALRLTAYLSESFEFLLSAGKKFRNFSNLEKAFQTAVETARYGMYRESFSILRYREVATEPLFDGDQELIGLHHLKDALFGADGVDVEEASDRLIDEASAKKLRFSRLIYLVQQWFISLDLSRNYSEVELREAYRCLQTLSASEFRLSRSSLCRRLTSLFLLLQRDFPIPRRVEACGLAGKVGEEIDLHFRNDLKLGWLAEQYHVNASYLGSLFKKQFRMSFNARLRQVRLNESLRLLETTDKKVYEIGMEVGFRENSYFLKCFEREFGTTPGKYRSARRIARGSVLE